MHALVTAPIPSHPQNHGNRSRVFGICRELQARGYEVHYVYSGLEGLSAEQEQAMRETWDHVYVIPHTAVQKKKSRRNHYLIDDWHSPRLTEITQRILAVWDIKLCLANYVWQSAWLEQVPASIPRYIDTHDVFGDRHKALIRDGIEPSWFFTTPREEAKALKRASTVIAIQDREAEVFKARSPTPVRTLGFFDPPRYLESPPAAEEDLSEGSRLKVGYIASDNPINVNALKGLVRELEKRPALRNLCDLYLAGPICSVETGGDAFTRLGFVPSVTGFYKDMDVILNPNMGGTGLKIKSVEALSYGRPLLATRDAMVGISVTHPLHQCADISSLCEGLEQLSATRSRVHELEAAGQATYSGYFQSQLETLDALFPRSGEEATT